MWPNTAWPMVGSPICRAKATWPRWSRCWPRKKTTFQRRRASLIAFRVATSSGRPRLTPEISAPMCSVRGFTSIVRVRSVMVASSTRCHEGGNLAQTSPPGLAERSRVDGGRHRLHRGQDLLREQPEALLRLGARHPSVEEVDDHHLEADRALQRSDLLDDLVGSPDRLGGAARREARVGHTDVGGLALEILLVAGNARVARVVPLEVVVLGREELVVKVLPAFLSLRGGLRAVHPQQRGRLIWRQPHPRPDRVEPPHLRRHLVEAGARDEHLPKAVLGGHPRGGLGGERRLDARGELALVPRLWADGGRRYLVDLAVEGEALGAV